MHGLTQPSTSLLKMWVRDNPNEKGQLYLKQKLMILLSEYLKVRATAWFLSEFEFLYPIVSWRDERVAIKYHNILVTPNPKLRASSVTSGLNINVKSRLEV